MPGRAIFSISTFASSAINDTWISKPKLLGIQIRFVEHHLKLSAEFSYEQILTIIHLDGRPVIIKLKR